MLVQMAGKGYWWTTGMVNKALLGQLTMTCTDSKLLELCLSLRPACNFDFDPLQVQLRFKTNLLYPNLAFSTMGEDGVVYERLDPETFRLDIYEKRAGEVARLHQLADNRGNVFNELYDFDEWREVESLIAGFEYDDITTR